MEKLVIAQQQIKPQWYHPLIFAKGGSLSLKKLEAMGYDYYLRFLPFFKNQPEGSLGYNVVIEFSKKMRARLGYVSLFERIIKLNQHYFSEKPALLPYTLFHELTHLWLYDCHLDPGHTRRFYFKMQQFLVTRLPEDPDVHIHQRVARESKYVYTCPRCEHRWYVNERSHAHWVCGYCQEKEKLEVLPILSMHKSIENTVIGNCG